MQAAALLYLATDYTDMHGLIGPQISQILRQAQHAENKTLNLRNPGA